MEGRRSKRDKRSKRGKRSRSKSNKKGAGHIEMIVSFSIFFLFVLFLFAYMNPVKPPTISGVLLDVVEQGLDDYKAKVLEIAVKVASGGCFQIECPFKDCSKEHVFVKDKDGELRGFDSSAGNLIIYGAAQTFYYIYHSNKIITPSPSGCQGQATPSYDFSVPKLQVLYLDSELEILNSAYDSNYGDLKIQFGFPRASDFSIIIYDEGDSVLFTMTTTKPKGVVVKAKDTPIVILEHDTKKIIKGSMNIQVW